MRFLIYLNQVMLPLKQSDGIQHFQLYAVLNMHLFQLHYEC